MARRTDQHLTEEELETLASVAEARRPDAGLSSPDERDVSLHLGTCERCQLLASRYLAASARLSTLRSGNDSPRGEECPPEEEWLRVAGGLLPAGRAEKDMLHAASCDHCGPLLRNAVEDLADDAEGQLVLDDLRSGRSEWQQDLAARLVRATRGSRHVVRAKTWRWKDVSLLPRLALAAGTLGFAALGAWLWVNVLRPASPEQLLAQAYTERRTLELRIAGAKHASVRTERGAAASHTDRPPELLEAEAIISKNLRANPGDWRWLHDKGQADLLDNNYESALSALDRAHRLAPNDDNISVDLASAYFQVAQSTDSPEKYNRAIELLRAVTVKNPGNDVAWFNLAIACERMHYYSEALEAWDSYLRVDPRSKWSAEARSRREDIQKKISKYKEDRQSTDDPCVLLQSENGCDPITLNGRVEDYVDVALTTWLREVASDDPRFGPGSATTKALHTLASLTAARQRDLWLKNIVDDVERSTLSHSPAIWLSKAVSLNSSGDYAQAQAAATEAERGFSRSRSTAGLLRARFEAAYATHLSQQGEACYSKAENLKRSLVGKSYAWLEIQTNLEAAICANMTGRIKEARFDANRAFELAKEVNYDSLYLRAAMELALLDWTGGNFADATKLANAGLEKFWSSGLPPMRGYSLYSVLDSVAEDSELWHADVTIDKEATELLDGDPDHGLLGFEYQRLANAAVHSGELEVARRYFEKSEQQFAQAPSGETLGIYKAASEVGLARLECQRGDCDAARVRLQAAEPILREASNRFVSWDFYATEGEVLLANGKPETALQSLLRALDIAERGLASKDSERERLVWMREYARTYRAAVKIELASDPSRAFQWWEWYKGAPVRIFGNETARAGNSANVQLDSATPPNEPYTQAVDGVVVLSYALFPEEAGVWLYDARGTRYHRISSSPAQLVELVRRFSEGCADPRSDSKQLAADGRQLYDLLVKPLVPHLISRKLLIESDGIFESVPFEALTTDQGTFLGEEFEIANSPGMAYLPLTRPVLTSRDIRNSLVVANPYAVGLNGPLEQLPSASAEAAEVAQLLPNARYFLGPSVSSNSLLEELSNADVFHFSGHAVVAGEGAALVLGSGEAPDESRVVDALQLRTVRLARTRLVVLSACATAGAEGRTLSETSSLARVFLSQGVPQVVASRWSVDSDATRQLIVLFYQHLLSGMTATESLRQARQQIRGKDELAHPYYWAGFSVFGKI